MVTRPGEAALMGVLTLGILGGIYWAAGSPPLATEAEARAVYELGKLTPNMRSWAISRLAGLAQSLTQHGDLTAATRVQVWIGDLQG